MPLYNFRNNLQFFYYSYSSFYKIAKLIRTSFHISLRLSPFDGFHIAMNLTLQDLKIAFVWFFSSFPFHTSLHFPSNRWPNLSVLAFIYHCFSQENTFRACFGSPSVPHKLHLNNILTHCLVGDLDSSKGQINSFGDKPGGLKVQI